MGWTYTDDMTSEKNQVRFLIQDTVSTKQRFQDEEIEWALSQSANVYVCAAELCDQLAVRIGGGGGIKSKKISEFAITYDATFYRELASSIRARGLGHQIPYAGGISVADKLASQSNPDWVQPKVERGLGDNPAAPAPDTNVTNPITTV